MSNTHANTAYIQLISLILCHKIVYVFALQTFRTAQKCSWFNIVYTFHESFCAYFFSNWLSIA